jgi:hypothetical protein
VGVTKLLGMLHSRKKYETSKVEAFVCFGALAKKFIMGFNFLQQLS